MASTNTADSRLQNAECVEQLLGMVAPELVPQSPDLGLAQECTIQEAYKSSFAEIAAIVNRSDAYPNTETFAGGEHPRKYDRMRRSEVLSQFRETLKFDGSRYTVGIPLRPGVETIGNSFRTAIEDRRWKLERLRKNPDEYEEYHQAIMSLVENGHAEKVEDFPSDIGVDDMDCHRGRYFASHNVYNEHTDEGVKRVLRIENSVKMGGDSTDMLASYMWMDTDETYLRSKEFLLNFRLNPVAFYARIADASFCINLDERYRSLFQILWQGPEDDRIQCYQLKKLYWRAMPVEFLLKAILKEHFTRVDPESLICLDSFYKDMIIQSFPTLEEATKFVDTVQDNLRSAGMELEELKTNSRSLADHIDSQSSTKVSVNVGLERLFRDPNPIYRNLKSLFWNPMDDTLRFRLETDGNEFLSAEFTDWNSFLEFTMHIKDEHGLFNPFLLRSKPLIWEAMRSPRSSDNEPKLIDSEILPKVRQWIREFETLLTIRIPRCISAKKLPCTDCHLHVFLGASAFTNATVVYMQTFSTDGASETFLVQSSAEVERTLSGTKQRGESELTVVAQAAYLANRIWQFSAAPLSRVLFYTDSEMTHRHLLFWSNATAEQVDAYYRTNRYPRCDGGEVPVDKIFHEISPECHLIPRADNVAHLITSGGISAEELRDSRVWWHGPEFIQPPETDRPTTPTHGAPGLKCIERESFRSLIARTSLRILDAFRRGWRIVVQKYRHLRATLTPQVQKHRKNDLHGVRV